MNLARLLPFLLLAIVCGYLLTSLRQAEARVAALEAALTDESPEVGIAMAWIQRWTDKLGRSADARHWELAGFYLHEIEETADELIAAGVVEEDGTKISELMQAMLMPAVESLEEAVAAQDLGLFVTHYTTLINTCNDCHVATKHPFIRVTPPTIGLNPWSQEFRKR